MSNLGKHRLWAAICGVLTLITGVIMFVLWRKEMFWGHLPLVLFTTGWAAIVLWRWPAFISHPRGRRWLGLSTLSGVLLALGFPPLPLTMLLFVAWVPLLIVEDEIRQAKTTEPANTTPNLLPYAYHAFAVWNILTTWWVDNTAFFAGIVAIWLNAAFMSVPFWLFSQTKRIIPRVAYGAFIAYWIAFEMLHLHWEITWPWLNLGNAFARFPSWIQWYEFTGTFGGTLWVLVANVILFFILRKIKSQPPGSSLPRGQLLQWALVVLVPIGISLVMYYTYHEQGRPVEVLVVQPNYEPHYQKFNVPQGEQLETLLQLTEGAIKPETRYVVFPETVFEGINLYAIRSAHVIRPLQRLMARHPDAVLVMGVGGYKVLRSGDPITRATRRQGEGDKLVLWEAYNAAIQIADGQDSIPVYLKSKLVPGAEILPYPTIFFFLKPLADKLGGSVEGLGTQPRRSVFVSKWGKVAPVICYESVFGDYHADYVRAGAEATFIMTNDGWWDNTPGHKQHLMYACLRAIETRRAIARSANTGISCFINQRGDIMQPTRYGEKAAIRGTIHFNDSITFYVRWGDLIGRIGVFTTFILLLNTAVKGYLQYRKAGDLQVKILSK